MAVRCRLGQERRISFARSVYFSLSHSNYCNDPEANSRREEKTERRDEFGVRGCEGGRGEERKVGRRAGR